MTGNDLYELYKKGIDIYIKFNKNVEELEIQFEKDMIAKIISMHVDDEDLYSITVDESDFKKKNKSLEKPDYFNDETKNYDLKYSDLYKRKDKEYLYVDKSIKLWNFEVLKNSFQNLIDEFNQSNEDSYVTWLEEKLSYYKAMYD